MVAAQASVLAMLPAGAMAGAAGAAMRAAARAIASLPFRPVRFMHASMSFLLLLGDFWIQPECSLCPITVRDSP
jgi:hypothetical protein